MAVHGGVVRAVYKIDGWIEPTEEDITEPPNRVGRYGFVGQRDEEMEERYLFADVTDYPPERGDWSIWINALSALLGALVGGAIASWRH